MSDTQDTINGSAVVPGEIIPEKKTKRRPPSRPQRWAEAVTEARKAFDDIHEVREALSQALGELRSIQEEYESWRDNMQGTNLENSPTYEKLEEVCNIDIEGVVDSSDLDDIENVLGEAEGADLPRGFGND